MRYSYHGRIKQRIRSGELIELGRQLSEDRQGAGSGVQYGTVPETDQAAQMGRIRRGGKE